MPSLARKMEMPVDGRQSETALAIVALVAWFFVPETRNRNQSDGHLRPASAGISRETTLDDAVETMRLVRDIFA